MSQMSHFRLTRPIPLAASCRLRPKSDRDAALHGKDAECHLRKLLLGLSQLVEQRLRLFQINRFESFSKPAVDRSKQFARFAQLDLVAPKTGQASGGAELP